MPVDPKGFVTVTILFATTHVALALIGDIGLVNVHVPLTRTIDVGNVTVI